MKKRLIEFLKYLGIGQDKFAKNVGLSRGYVNNINDNITMKTVDKILKAYPELNKNWLLTGEGKMLEENFLEDEQTESCEDNKLLSEQSELNLSEFIAMGKSTVEISRMNAESFKKIADSHDILIKSHDKLIDLFKESLSVKNDSKIDVLIEKLDDFLEYSKSNRANGSVNTGSL